MTRRTALRCAAAMLLALACGQAVAQEPPAAEPARTLDELLQRVRAGSLRDAAVDAERAARFAGQKEKQQQTLEAARKQLTDAQRHAAELEKQWEENQQLIGQRQLELRERLGSLAEVFAVLGSAGGELRARLQDSPTSAQLGAQRVQELDGLLETAASGTRLPSIERLDGLWFELQRELAEAGRVRRFEAELVGADGTRVKGPVVRAGLFALVEDEGNYLVFDGPDASLATLGRQPAAAVREEAAQLALAREGQHALTLDPLGVDGFPVLRTAVTAPGLTERINAAGMLGWAIMLLGATAIGFALYRLVTLEQLRARIAAHRGPLAQHPLPGLRELAHQLVLHDAESLEHALHEALLKALPRLERGLAPLRVAGSALPLFGVLGTVLALTAAVEPGIGASRAGATLFTADLAQALVTTVQGLLLGIAVLLLHALLAARTRTLVHLLESQAAAEVSARAGVDRP